MSQEVIEEFSKVRVELNTTLNTMRSMDAKSRSRGLSLGTTALEKGIMYLGEVQLALGSEFPYEATKKATTPKEIQKALDSSPKTFPLDKNEITNLNSIREVIQGNLNTVLDTFMWYAEQRKNKDIKEKFVQDASFAEAYRSIKEARMWLGIRLGEIKSNNG